MTTGPAPITGKDWQNHVEPRIMAEDLRALEQGIQQALDSGVDVSQAVEDYLTANPPAGSGGYPVQRVSLTGAYTVDPTGWPTSEIVTMVLTQDATGNRTVTLPSSIVTAYGVTWAPGRAAGSESVATFRYSAGLAKWVCEGCWISIAGGVPTDTTAPTLGTLNVSSITNVAFTLTVAGASDTGGLHTAPYAFAIDGVWSAYRASNTYIVSGLTAATAYEVNWRVRDAAGNVAQGTARTVTTAATADTTPPVWSATFTPVGVPTSTVAVFQASAMATDDMGVANYEVSYDGGSTWEPITVEVDWTFQLQGEGGITYTQTKVRATDAAGNSSVPLSVPSYTMAPAQSLLVWDDFNRPDGPLVTTTSGHPWILESGTQMPSVEDNQLVRGFTGGTSPVVTVDAGTAEQYVSVRVHVGGSSRIYARYVDSDNYYSISVGNDGTTPRVYRKTAGSENSLGANVTSVLGDRVGFSFKEEGGGLRVHLLVNGVSAANYLDSTEGRPAGTKAGLFVNSATPASGLDDFEVRDA